MCRRNRVNFTDAVERWPWGVLLPDRARRLRNHSTPVGFLGIEQFAPASWPGLSSTLPSAEAPLSRAMTKPNRL
jgi:hypothetical protein